MKIICSVCQKDFETTIRNKIYCSNACYLQACKERAKNWYLLNKANVIKNNSEWYQKHKHPCPTCGKLIAHTARGCRKHSGSGRSGSENHGWKGGRVKTGGYIHILQPNHPRANTFGYTAEHIIVWEQTHHKTLLDGWVIHHLNGTKDDNRPQNLVALPNMKHKFVLEAKAKRIQELEALLKGQGFLI